MGESFRSAATFAERASKTGRPLKHPDHGGPSYKTYGHGDMNNLGYISDHPRYPDWTYPDDEARDTYYDTKKDLAKQMPLGLVHASDADVQYLIDKKNVQQLTLFKQFVEDSIPRGTPWAKEFFEKINPGWYQSKIDIIRSKLDIVQKFVEITVVGPQSMDDMFLLWLLYAGKITLPRNFQDLIKPGNQGLAPVQFASGLFCPRKWIQSEYMLSRRNQDYLANFVIPGIDVKGLPHSAANGDLNDNFNMTMGANEMYHDREWAGNYMVAGGRRGQDSGWTDNTRPGTTFTQGWGELQNASLFNRGDYATAAFTAHPAYQAQYDEAQNAAQLRAQIRGLGIQGLQPVV